MLLLLLLLLILPVFPAVVPPGYMLPAGTGPMQKCASTATVGYFREGWVMHNDQRAQACTPCGDGILSEAREFDVNPLESNTSLVMATSASCCK